MASFSDNFPHDEPQIQDLLDDPIAKLLMQMDGVERSTLDPLLKQAADRLDEREPA